MDKESYAPMINIDVVLLYAQKPYVGVVREVGNGYPRHQKSEKRERQEQQRIKTIKTHEKKFCFKQNTCHETDHDLTYYRAICRFELLGLQFKQNGIDG